MTEFKTDLSILRFSQTLAFNPQATLRFAHHDYQRNRHQNCPLYRF